MTGSQFNALVAANEIKQKSDQIKVIAECDYSSKMEFLYVLRVNYKVFAVAVTNEGIIDNELNTMKFCHMSFLMKKQNGEGI